MSIKNKRILTILSLILLAGYVIIGSALYEYTHKYAEDQNKKKLDQILLNQRALHTYLEDHLKPVIYKLKEEGKLYNDFFDPRILSFTYIARGIHEQLNTLRSEENTTQIYYKLATDNPRNPINKANIQELNILNNFRKNPSLKEYSLNIEENGLHYIYYAMPIEANKASCMKCHSTPDKAPDELIAQYGSSAGFGEKEGSVRAIISLKMPFDDELNEANEIFKLIMMILTLFLLLLYSVIFYFLRRLDESQHIIEEKNKTLSILAERDGLTGVFNRRSFDSDLANQIDDPSLVLTIFDIDHFKRINDTYGHLKGDFVLQELTTLVHSNLRDSDYLYRIGGEEFAILSHRHHPADIEHVVVRLLKAISEHDFGLDEHIYISAGISGRLDGDTPITLYKRADDALYQAKENGRNRYIIS
jgi:diguanylate cyclase (GGDEF)-like protein